MRVSSSHIPKEVSSEEGMESRSSDVLAIQMCVCVCVCVCVEGGGGRGLMCVKVIFHSIFPNSTFFVVAPFHIIYTFKQKLLALGLTQACQNMYKVKQVKIKHFYFQFYSLLCIKYSPLWR